MVPKASAIKKRLKVTLNKRQRGILRKAMELSTLGDLDIYMGIYDKENNNYVEYRSTPQFNPGCFDPDVTKELYDNGDYDELKEKFIRRT